jgi:hypothetical protein
VSVEYGVNFERFSFLYKLQGLSLLSYHGKSLIASSVSVSFG